MSNINEIVWSEILSRQPARIKYAFASLKAEEQARVRTHLQKMAGEDGWHPEQVLSAKAALEAIGSE